MSATRKIHWATAMHGLAADRAQRAPVREEPLRAAIRGPYPLTSWRGESGRRYVFSIVEMDRVEEFAQAPFVAMAVRRDATGAATPIAARAMGDLTADLGWLAACCATFDANELHICGICETPGLARVAARDLAPGLPARAGCAA